MRRIGIDTGGTFTDCVLWDPAVGELVTAKVPSRPREPHLAVGEGLRRLLLAAGSEAEDVDFVAHGTTIATNAVITGELAAAGLLTNRGFRDVLEIGTQQRPSLYRLQQAKRHVPIPRDRRLEIAGRIAFDGTELEPIDADEVEAQARRLVAMGVDSIAIAMLFSFVDPRHEEAVEAIVRSVAPDLYVTRSSAVSPELREYPRFATTAANASLAPLLDRYIGTLASDLARAGYRVPLHVMQSNGGLATARRSTGEHAHRLVLSGPAAGVIGGSFVAAAAGFSEAVTIDIGGTSADIGVVVDGAPRMRLGMALPTGLPLQIPTLEVEAIGAGGGSIATVDAGGALRVGPRSAGADPGPACYGMGGTAPTLTDAHLVLGRLDPGAFLGGEVRLDVQLARDAIERSVARPLELGIEEAARGIVAVADANMVGAIRATAARHGDDLRDSVLVAGGGAGPLHAVALAAELGMPAVCVPRTPGLLSALGLLATDLRHDLSGPLLAFAAELDEARLERAFAELETEAAHRLAADQVEPADRGLGRAIDLRAIGQEWTLTVPVGPGESVARVVERFHAQHERVYGHAAPDQPVESVAVRVVATGRFPRPTTRHEGAPARLPGRDRSRRAWFAEVGAFVDARVLDRAAVGPGDRLVGPAIVEQLDTTVLVPPGYTARVAALDSLVIERSEP